eukprot:jgi/Psemu1/307273/fgenesh1_kg.318_\
MPPFSAEQQFSFEFVSDSDFQDDTEMDTFDHVKTQQQRSSPPARKRKSVRFSEYAKISFIPGLDYYSKEEIESMYLTEEDAVKIRCDVVQTIRKLSDGDMPDSESDYFRGLEWRGVSCLHYRRKVLKHIALHAILHKQYESDGTEICPDWIENVYSKITEESMDKAIRVAQWDAQCA